MYLYRVLLLITELPPITPNSPQGEQQGDQQGLQVDWQVTDMKSNCNWSDENAFMNAFLLVFYS